MLTCDNASTTAVLSVMPPIRDSQLQSIDQADSNTICLGNGVHFEWV